MASPLPITLPWLLLTLHILPLALSSQTQRSTYIVHMDKSLMPTAFPTHHHWYSAAVDSTATPSDGKPLSSPKLLYSYDSVLHGFSASLSEDELNALKKSSGFVAAYKDRTFELQTTYSPAFLKLNSETGLWPASQFGEDVIIGVIDSGVWPESPSFRDDGMREVPKRWKGICKPGQDFDSSLCNKKLIGANYFNAGVLADKPGVQISMNSSRDTNGHGTHTASTAAGNSVGNASYSGYANGTARGLAPRARLAVYKVSWDEGSFSSDLIAGMDQAVADGVDVISISLGFQKTPLAEDPLAITSFNAMMKGVLVAGSAGNSGPGIGTLNSGFPWILTVGSGSTDRWFAGTLTLGNGLKIRGWSLYSGEKTVENMSLLYDSSISDCDSPEVVNPNSTILICVGPRAVNVFSSQMQSVTDAGILATIFINDEPRIFRSVTNFPSPGVVISREDGNQVIAYAKNTTNPRASITFHETFAGKKAAPAVDASSSRGPSPSYPGILKPDILAPGVLILAAYPPKEKGAAAGYYLQSGTSMACPQAAAIAALLKGAHPNWSPSAIRSAMMTTATTLDNTGNRIKESDDNSVATPLAIGSGMVNPNRAVDPGLIYDATPQDYVNLLCSMNLTEKEFHSIARSSATYNCSSPDPDLNYPSFIALYPTGGENEVFDWLVQTFKRTVTNVGPTGLVTYNAVIETPNNSNISVSPSTLVFTQNNQKMSYHLTISYRGDEKHSKNVGSITWVEVKGNHTVRSPIIVSNTIEVW
ncbi:unnamed protein product [Cuscuta epithymum]|uniref:Uncharacterized protein n=1 Tax=Cuscuta epithymum TaxID=186058 RepID=A0AAV0CUX2_9ASTE|nr:unnamed protein product [Cuscuta epithymum]